MKRMGSFFFMVTAVMAWGAQNVAIVKNVAGNVQVKHGGVYKPLSAGAFLEEGDLILTDETGRVGVSFNDGTTISLGPKSVFSLNRYRFRPAAGEFGFDATLTRGQALIETGKMGKLAPQKVRFHVPQGYIGIRGTRFIIDVEE